MPVNGKLIDLEAAEWVYFVSVANINETNIRTQGVKRNEWVYLFWLKYTNSGGGGGFAAAPPEWVYVFH